MPEKNYQIDYNEFMQWFATNYNDIFSKYASNIISASDGTGLKIRVGNLDQETYNILFNIQNEFYSIKQ